jgi:hypothetical protein
LKIIARRCAALLALWLAACATTPPPRPLPQLTAAPPAFE